MIGAGVTDSLTLRLSAHGAQVHIPSKKNSRRWIKRGGRKRSIPSEAHEKWENACMADISYQIKQMTPPYAVSVRFYLGSRNTFDLSNSFESIADMLVKVGVLTDDNCMDLTSITMEVSGLSRRDAYALTTISTMKKTPARYALEFLFDEPTLKKYIAGLPWKGRAKSKRQFAIAYENKLWADLADFDEYDNRHSTRAEMLTQLEQI